MNFNEFNNKERIGLMLFALSIFYIIFTSYFGIFDLKIWADEAWSLFVSYSSVKDFFAMTVNDVHPILYYVILKAFIKFFELFNYTNIFVIGVIVSLIPFYLLLVVSATKVRKNFGMLTAGIFALCITSMPQLMQYAVEIRMYSWGLFFVTTSFIYVYEIIGDSDWKKWAILTVLTLCSAYTHYFSAIASVAIYLTLLVYILYKKRQLLKVWLISAIISILAYVPWLFIVFNQFTSVRRGFWINPISFDTIISYIYYVLSPVVVEVKSNELVPPTIMGTVVLIAIIALIYKYLKDKKDFKDNYAIWALVIFISVPVVGISISLLFNPVFHVRYIVPVLGCFWLAISILLANIYTNKKIFLPILVIILIIGAIGAYTFYQNDVNENPISDYKEFCDDLKPYLKHGDIIITDFRDTYLFSEIEFTECHCIYLDEANFNSKILPSLHNPQIQNEIADGANVYYMDFATDNFNECVQNNITLKKLDISEDIMRIYKLFL